MKRISLFILIMFIGVGFVNALENVPELKVISNDDDSVVLRVNIDGVDKNEVCYIHRSLDNIVYNDKMMVDCNKMYTDNNIDKDMTYYYKASVGNDDVFSEVIMIDTYSDDDNLSEYKLSDEKIPRDPFIGIVVFIVTAVIFLALVMILIIVSKKYVDNDKSKKTKKGSIKK